MYQPVCVGNTCNLEVIKFLCSFKGLSGDFGTPFKVNIHMQLAAVLYETIHTYP